MENRFGIKDFILILLICTAIVLIVVKMVQDDRQWEQLQLIRNSITAQQRDVQKLQDKVQEIALKGLAVNPVTPATGEGAAGTALNRASGGPSGVNGMDPFARIRAAQELPNYAKGDWLVQGFGNTVGNLTPFVSSDAYASEVQGHVLESLGARDPVTLEWSPLLAENWETIDNSKTFNEYVEREKAKGRAEEEILKDADLPAALQFKFKMRNGPTFSDGTAVTADDVVFTYDFIMNEKINAPRERAYFSRITDLEKTGPDEVTFTFKEPYFEAFELAAGFPVLPKHFYDQFEPEEFNQSVGYLMGSGPYRMPDPKSWKPGTPIYLVRNERYWGVQPAFDRLVYREISNDAAHLAAFRNGDVDTFVAQPEQYKEMISDASLVARTQHFEYQNPVGGYRYVAWNQQRNGKPTVFADPRVRRAMTLLINKDRLIQEIMLGYAVPATGPFNPLSKQSSPEVQPWPYDPSQAKELLKQARFEDRNADGLLEGPDGKPFEFKLTYPSGNANYERMVLFLKDSFARAGIALKPDPLDWSVLVERLNNKNFDAITLAWTAGIEGDIYQMFHSTQAIAGGDNFMSYRSEQLDKLIDQARRTIDEEKRMPLWRQAHAVIHEDQPYTFLFFPKSLRFMDDRIANVQKIKLGLNPPAEWFVPLEEQRWGR